MNRRSRRRVVLRVAAACLAAALAACAGGSGGGGSKAGAKPTATAVGAPTDAVLSKTIGAAGDTLTSADGKVTLTVPAGALAGDTDIGIQTIGNTAHGGVGSGYRLTPDGQMFAAPVTLTFTYTDGDVAGSAAAGLGVAFQRADGFWAWVGGAVVDLGAKTVSVTTDHFTDYAAVQGFQILPSAASVDTGTSLGLQVAYCFDPFADPGADDSLAYPCDPLAFTADPDLVPFVPAATVSDWSVDGIPGGDGTVGTVDGDDGEAVYHAPAVVPAGNPVDASALVAWGDGAETVAAAITIVAGPGDGGGGGSDGAPLVYAGPIDFQLDSQYATGSSTVTWTRFEDLPDVARYLPSGDLDVTISLDGCDPLDVSLPIETGTPALPVDTLVVYLGTSPFAGRYQFALSSVPQALTFSCGDPRAPVTIEHYYLSVPVGLCGSGPGDFPEYGDLAELQNDGWVCAPDVAAGWDFIAQAAP